MLQFKAVFNINHASRFSYFHKNAKIMRTFLQLFMLHICLFQGISTMAQSTPSEVVQAQLDAYNQGDIDGFMATFSEEVVFIDSQGKTIMQGETAVRERYAAYFKASPNLHSNIQKRVVQGNKVIDHEYITGRYGDPSVYELVLVFEVENEQIARVVVLSPDI
jgi:hypothetical protein